MRVEQMIKYCFLILVAGMICGCDREEVSEELQGIESFQILPDENVKWSLGAIAIEGAVLLTYIDNLNEYVFKLIENDGTEIWTKKFGYLYETNESGEMTRIIALQSFMKMALRRSIFKEKLLILKMILFGLILEFSRYSTYRSVIKVHT
jgi:hypothetical protein